MKTEIQLTLTQVGASSPGKEDRIFNEVKKTFPSLDEARAWLRDSYGIEKPKRLHDGNSVFVDSETGARRVGWLTRRWNSDVSHNSKSWWETNWVSFRSMEEKEFAL